MKLVIQYNKLDMLQNNLRLRILENYEILEQSEIWVEAQPSSQSPLHKLNFGKSNRKIYKSRYQSFLDLCNFIGFLYYTGFLYSKYFFPDCSKDCIFSIFSGIFLPLASSSRDQTVASKIFNFNKFLSEICIFTFL